jgi:hypothetical protein
MKQALWMALFAVALVGCSEQPQSHGLKRSDKAPYAGTGQPFMDAGWKAGDKAAWESHLKARTQRGQNDYYGVTN